MTSPAASKYPASGSRFYYASKHRILGIIQMIIGALLCLIDIVALCLILSGTANLIVFYELFWCALPTVLCGVFAYKAQQRSSQCLLMATLVLALINTVAYFGSIAAATRAIGFYSISIQALGMAKEPVSWDIYSITYFGYLSNIAWLVASLVMIPLAIWQIVICSGDRFTQCCCYRPPIRYGNEDVAAGGVGDELPGSEEELRDDSTEMA